MKDDFEVANAWADAEELIRQEEEARLAARCNWLPPAAVGSRIFSARKLASSMGRPSVRCALLE